MKIASGGKREFSRNVGLCVLAMALAWGSGLANAAQKDAGEPTPLKLTVKRPLSTADIEGGKLRAQVHAAQGLGERRAEIAREHPNDQKGQGSQGDRDGVAFFRATSAFRAERS
jgi:hypothetical protein